MVDDALSSDFPLEVIRHKDAERSIDQLRDDPDLPSYLRIEERELNAGGLN